MGPDCQREEGEEWRGDAGLLGHSWATERGSVGPCKERGKGLPLDQQAKKRGVETFLFFFFFSNFQMNFEIQINLKFDFKSHNTKTICSNMNAHT